MIRLGCVPFALPVGAAAARQAHNLKVTGSIPVPASRGRRASTSAVRSGLTVMLNGVDPEAPSHSTTRPSRGHPFSWAITPPVMVYTESIIKAPCHRVPGVTVISRLVLMRPPSRVIYPARRAGLRMTRMAAPNNVATIYALADAAIVAGDLTEATKQARRLRMALASMPRSHKGDEQIDWDAALRALDDVIKDLRKEDDAAVASSASTGAIRVTELVYVPVSGSSGSVS